MTPRFPSPLPRLALIGVSGYGRIHLQLAVEGRNRKELMIVAATVINPAEEVAVVDELRGQGTEIFADYTEMLQQHAGKIDLCLIPTGIHWHARMTIAALESGANVLVEKPLAGSVAEVRAIRQAEQRTGRFVAVGFQDIYEPGTRWLRAELQRGVIGRIESVRFLGVWPRPRSYFTRNNWAGCLQVDGVAVMDSPLNNAFAHFVMLSLFFAGDGPADGTTVVEGAELLRAHAIESFDTAVVRSCTPSGVKLWFGASHACRETTEPEIVIAGSHGEACWRYETEAWWRSSSGESTRHTVLDITGARQSMFNAVRHRLGDASVPICTSAQAGQHTALIESIHQHGRIVVVAPEAVSWVDGKGGMREEPEIIGLYEGFRRAYATGRSLAESGWTFPLVG